MILKSIARHSLKARITLATLTIFVVSIWLLVFHAGRILHEDMQRQLGEQQFSVVSLVATEIDSELDDRIRALESAAARIPPSMLANPAALQRFLEDRTTLGGMFNAGLGIIDSSGTAIASTPVSVGRVGVNYMERDYIAAALKEGRSSVSQPTIAKLLKTPVFGIAAPIRDGQGKVIGALAGLIDLGRTNFLDKITTNGYGKTGGYLLLAPQFRLIVTGTDKSRVMTNHPAPGINELADKFIGGYEGTATGMNRVGVEVLASATRVGVAGWVLVASLPTAEAFAPIRDMQQRIALTGLALTALAGALTWWLLRRQFAPLEVATSALASRAAAGAVPQPLPLGGADEVGTLIGAFNELLEDLRQSGALNETLLRTIPFPMDIVDPHGRILYASGLLEQMVGRPAAGERCWTLYRDDHTQCHDCPLRQPVAVGHTAVLESSGVFGGKTFEIQHAGMLYQGKPAIMEIFLDITERQRIDAHIKERNAELTQLYATLERVREEERQRLARELHDDLGQRVTALRMDLDWIDARLPSDLPAVSAKMGGVAAQIDELTDSIRRLIEDMRPGMLDTLGLVTAIEDYVNKFAARSGISCEWSSSHDEIDAGDRAGIGLFRIVQEALNNILKHAQATRVSVALRHTGDTIVLLIADNGRGLPDADTPGRKGFGVLGMRERVSILNGKFSMTSTPGEGVRIQVVVPV